MQKNKSNLESIEIIGLFNKRNFFIKFDEIVKILISENGSGKTTILNIIVSSLKKDIITLRKMPFKIIKIKLKNGDSYCIDKDKFFKNPGFSVDIIYNIERAGRRYGIEKNIIKDIIEVYSATHDIRSILKEIEKEELPYNFTERIKSLLFSYLDKDLKNSEELDEYTSFIEKLDFKVEYLPTYRRIEIDYDDRLNYEDRGERNYKSEMNFGMTDIEKIIDKLTREIKFETARLFSEMNKEILYDLLNNKNMLSSQERKDLINNPKIQIVLSRIQDLSDSRNLIKLLEKAIESKNFKGEFLGYYLLKIINIYEKQEEKENRIKNFINICNTYLFNKEFIYLDKETKIKIVDEEKNEISLSALSSGEKQIISLFSKLYLEDRDNLMVVIDEPELSISILWQKKILLDIVKSNKCKLLLTTTHSPFIFDNEFDIYADELKRYFFPYVKGD